MAYVDGFVAAVPSANKKQYITHAELAGEVFMENGALQYIECWGDEVPEGEITSFPKAVKCKPEETVCFGWVLWPSREARNAGMEKVMQDKRMNMQDNPMPFDGMRLIYAGFETIVEK